MTIHQRVASARQRLRDAGLSPDEADLGARLLAEHLLGWDTARFFTSGHDPAPEGFAAPYDALVSRRATREPLAYVTGRQEFWNLAFEVSPNVLIPRPETELIVEAALELLGASTGALRIADACTGSGCLAVALARELPHAHIVATDISDAALDVARRNAARHLVGERIDFVRTDVLDEAVGTLRSDRREPAVCADRRPAGPAAGSPASTSRRSRSSAGPTGRKSWRALVDQAAARLHAGAHLIFEFGFGQDMAVEQLIADAPGLTLVGLRRDLQGIARTAIARRL